MKRIIISLALLLSCVMLLAGCKHYDISVGTVEENGKCAAVQISSRITLRGEESGKMKEKLSCFNGPTLINDSDSVADTGENATTGNLGIAILCALLGIWFVVSPHSAWMVGHGWRFKGAQPSKVALIVYRIIGGGLIVLAIVKFFF